MSEMIRPTEATPITTWEASEVLAVNGLAVPYDFNLNKVDADLASHLSACPNPDTRLLRIMGFGEDLTFLKSQRAKSPAPLRHRPVDRMDPYEQYDLAARHPEPFTRPYNT
jgi:hypothetical protein